MSYPTWITSSNLGSESSGTTGLTYTLTASTDTTSITIIDSQLGVLTINGNAVTLELDAPNVVADTKYKWVLRAANSTGITDRTFTLSITAGAGIEWTQAQALSNWIIGSRREIVLSASWPTPLEYVLLNGQLPPGVLLDASGVVYGIAGSNLTATSTVSDNWSITGVPVVTGSSYEFTVRARSISQKNIYVDRTFTISTVTVDSVYASSTELTASSTVSTSDSATSLPIILLTSNYLGTYRHNNQFLKQIRAWNPTGEEIEFNLQGEENAYDMQGYDEGSILGYDGYQATTAPYLQVELRNGYVTGLIPNINYQLQENSFSVAIKKVNDTVTGPDTLIPEFTLDIVGNDGINYAFTDPNGNDIADSAVYRYSIRNGQTSDLSIRARQVENPTTPLFCELVSGGLPAGLTLTPRGLISGQVSWSVAPGVYEFAVKVYNPSQDYSELSPLTTQTQQFEIEVLPFLAGVTKIDAAYNIFYRAYMTNSQRTVWRNLVTDQRIFNNSIIYRAEDSEFSRRLECEFLAFVGIGESDAAAFADAVSQNWSMKRFRLGNLHFATVMDTAGNHLCDTIYVDIIDPQLNARGMGPPQIVDIPNTDAQQYITEIYPASLQNQLERLQADPGQATDSLLPRWMTSPQADGRPLGWIPGAVLCHVLPGQGAQVLRKIKTSNHKLSYIDFHVDRMVLQGSMIVETTFDDGATTFIYTSFDTATTEDKYIYFNTDGAIYDINN